MSCHVRGWGGRRSEHDVPGMGFPDSDGSGGGSDSGGFGWIPSSNSGIFSRILQSVRLYGHFDPMKMDSGFGRIR
jgi:hypothetical protein